jgi:hypothetical protein
MILDVLCITVMSFHRFFPHDTRATIWTGSPHYRGFTIAILQIVLYIIHSVYQYMCLLYKTINKSSLGHQPLSGHPPAQ